MAKKAPAKPSAPPSVVASINFVFTAIYTVTFANAVYRVARFDSRRVDITFRHEATTLMCAGMCIVMALRFLFGNNNFMDGVFTSPEGPWKRFYHFIVTTAQGLILLGSSYLVTNPKQFVAWLGALFVMEVVWYVGSLLWSRHSVTESGGRFRWKLLWHETSNAAVAVTAILALVVLRHHLHAMVYVVFAAFVLNTAVDARHNLSSYMGISP